MKSPRRVLLLIWVCFVLRGVFYSAMFPIWEGYDEAFHFAYLQQLINNQTVPDVRTPFPRELLQSLHVLPLPWRLSQERLPPPFFSHEDYWKLPQVERERLQKQFREMPLSWSRENSAETGISNYETQQMPLYYLLFYLPLKFMSGLSLASRVFLLRILNILLASCFVPIGYLVALRALNNKNLALSVLVFVTALPELFVDLARVGNESLALLIYTVAIYFALKIVEGPQNLKYFPWLGITSGLGLLTKAYFLTALPALLLIVSWCYWQWPREKRRLIKDAALAAAALCIIAGPWYWRVHTLTGSWSGVTDDIAVRSISRWQMLAQVPHVNWVSGIVSILLSHVWFGAWSFLKFSRPVYLFFGLIILLAVLGISGPVVVLCFLLVGTDLRHIACLYPSGCFCEHWLVHVFPDRAGSNSPVSGIICSCHKKNSLVDSTVPDQPVCAARSLWIAFSAGSLLHRRDLSRRPESRCRGWNRRAHSHGNSRVRPAFER